MGHLIVILWQISLLNTRSLIQINLLGKWSIILTLDKVYNVVGNVTIIKHR